MRRRDTLAAIPALLLGSPRLALAQAGGGPVRKVAGSQHFLALMADGSVVGWGRHREGQLGEAALQAKRGRYGVAAPVRVALPRPAVDIAAGATSSHAVLDDGSVWAWGRGVDGELGLGAAARSAEHGIATPRRIDELDDIVQVSVDGNAGHALARDGALFSWGSRDGGRVGDGVLAARWGETPPPADTPVPATLLRGLRLARLGPHSAGVAIDADGRVLQWPPLRGPAKEGDTWKPLEATVSEVPLPAQAIDVGSTGGARLALLRDGTVWAWGFNMQGLWGTGARADTNDADRWRGTPQPVPGVRQAVALATGTLGRHALVLLRDGTLRGWGNSDWGQIGAGVDGDDQPKVVTPRLANVARVWAGGNNSFALTRDGRFWSWGASQDGAGVLGAQSKVPVAWPAGLMQPA